MLFKKSKNKKKLETAFLLVDDDSGSRQILADYLRSFGYEKIFEAADGQQALKILKEQQINFILSDWEMPRMNGLDFLRIVRSDPKYNSIPFVIVTSPISDEKYKVEDAALSKVDSYIIKPFRADVLKSKIDLVLSNQVLNLRTGALVVDDDSEVRSLVIETLRSLSYTPLFEATNGDEAYELLKNNQDKIAFVVSDWEMPKLSGIDLLKKIRNTEELKKVPFIMITSQTSIERVKVKQALEADVDHYLLKPFRVDDFKEKIDYALKNAKEQISIDLDMKRANDYLEHSRWAEASKIFAKIMAKHPKYIEAHLGMGNAQRHLYPEKAIPNATQHIRKALEINPRCEQAYVDLASIFESAMSLEKAMTCLREALQFCPLSAIIHFNFARLLIRRGNKEDAFIMINKALELDPNHEPSKELMKLHFAKGEEDGN